MSDPGVWGAEFEKAVRLARDLNQDGYEVQLCAHKGLVSVRVGLYVEMSEAAAEELRALLRDAPFWQLFEACAARHRFRLVFCGGPLFEPLEGPYA